MDLKIILTLCLCALTVAQDVAPNQSINKPEIVQINPAHDDVSLQSFSNSPSIGLPNTQKDFNAFIQFAQNQPNPYLSPLINNPYQFQQQPQLQQQQQLQYLQQFQTPQTPLLQASLQSSLPSFLYQNFINKPLNFFKPQQQQPPQFPNYPNYPTGLIQSPQFPNYPNHPTGLIQSPQFFPTSSSLQSQYVPNYHHQPQLVASSNQYYPQFSSNPYQNVLPSQNTYYPQTSSQYPQFNQQVSTINYPQIPNSMPAVNSGNSGYQFIQPNPSYIQPSSPNPSYVQPSIPYAPYIPHGQVQYSQQLQTPFLVDLARYIYGK